MNNHSIAFFLLFTVLTALTCRKISENDYNATACFTFETPPAPCLVDCPVRFTNCSAYGSAFEWDFGDGTVHSTETNPEHTYRYPGIYTVRLNVFRLDAVKQVEQTVTIPTQYQVDFNIAGTAPYYTASSLRFENLSANADAFEWDFGDGSAKSSEANPSHVYDAPGTYLVMLTARKDGSPIGMSSQSIEVKKFPTYNQPIYFPDAGAISRMLETSDGGLAITLALFFSGTQNQAHIYKITNAGKLEWVHPIDLPFKSLYDYTGLLRLRDNTLVALGVQGQLLQIKENRSVVRQADLPGDFSTRFLIERDEPGRILTAQRLDDKWSVVEVDLATETVSSILSLDQLAYGTPFVGQITPDKGLLVGGGTLATGGSLGMFDSLLHPVFTKTNFTLAPIFGLISDSDQGIIFQSYKSFCKIDRQGNLLWCNSFDDSARFTMAGTRDNQLVYSYLENNQAVFIKLDTKSNTVLWKKTLPVAPGAYATQIVALTDGGYALCIRPPGFTESYFFILKTNPFGDL